MKQTLINKYLAGETTISEERELRQLLLDTPDAQRSKSERSILELLSYSGNEDMEEDIFTVDYTEEYDKHVRPSRTIRLWPWLVAACVAGLFMIVLTPPKGPQEAHHQAPQSTQGELQIAQVTEDSTKHDKEPQHLIANAEHKAMKKKETSVPVIKDKEALSCKTECVEENETEYLVAQEDPAYSSEQEPTEQNIFYAALSEVRRNTLVKMMSCDMQCMNEEIQYRGNRLATLINEQ